MELAATALPAFALFAGCAGACAAIGLVRDQWTGQPQPRAREGLICVLGIAALTLAFAGGASAQVTMAAGALLVAGLAIMASAPRPAGRRSAGRQVGLLIGWAGIVAAMIGAFFPGLGVPHSGA